MLSVNEIKTAVEWLAKNDSYKLFQWTVNNFGGIDCDMAEMLKKEKHENFAKEIAKYGADIQIELVELMYQ